MTFLNARMLGSLALVLSVSWTTLSHADEVADKAEEGLADLRFEDARDIALKGLAEGTRGPTELAPLYMILGQVAASLGEESEAHEYFLAALSLDSSSALPEGISPKLSEPFAAASEKLADAKPIAVLAELDGEGQLSLQVESDPAKLVAGAEARFVVDGKTETLRGEGSDIVRLDIPAGAEDVQVSPIDTYGNPLGDPVSVGEGALEVKVEPTPKTIEATSPSPAIYKRWQLYAGLAVGTLATGAFFGNASQAKADEITLLEDGTEFSVAQALEDQAKSKALIANIGFAATAALGAAAVWMYVSEDSKSESETATAVVPMLGADRVGVAASVRF